MLVSVLAGGRATAEAQTPPIVLHVACDVSSAARTLTFTATLKNDASSDVAQGIGPALVRRSLTTHGGYGPTHVEPDRFIKTTSRMSRAADQRPHVDDGDRGRGRGEI